uniref:Laminin subunit beta-1 n=1 Tax=Anthurium amnicola TaxID=1678845 RepID=A0A1D1XNH7_9ARAE
MLNTSGHFLELVCPVPSSVITSFPSLRYLHHYYSYYYRHGPRLLLPCWDHLRVALLPHLPAHHAPSLCFFLLFFLFCFSVLLARSIVLRSIQKQEAVSDSRRWNSSNGAECFWDEANVDCYDGDGPTDEDMVADVILEGEALLFLSKKETNVDTLLVRQGEDARDSSSSAESTLPSESVYASPLGFLTSEEAELDQINSPTPDSVTACPSVTVEERNLKTEQNNLHAEGKNFSGDEIGFTVAQDVHLIKKAFKSRLDEKENQVACDASTVGSTSKSSADWRSSTNLRDSETEHLFSSSSRKSSSKWESYAVFRKYDEEMMYFDRISAQKLNEAEALRSMKVHQRSISKRIVHKLTTRDKQFTRFKDPYRELEAAYVAQICLTWEALNWNYQYFQQVHANRGEDDNGCSAHMAQQFQQFQVLLQRYIENEPYEYGRRPEVYARRRVAAPKLLQVPEFHDSADKTDKECSEWRISSAEFLRILEDVIRTFMNFLRADKENHWQMLRALVKKKASSVDPTLLHLLRKVNEKKRRRLKDILRRGKCLRKRKPREENEMEILMALIDMKIVSRVMWMPEISEEQLHWCEEKISRVKVWEGRMQRDSSPLFFPAH